MAAEGSTEHQVCLTGKGDPIQRAFTHDAAGIGAMVDWLCAQTPQPNQVAVAIETLHGPIVEALMDRGVAVFAINPKRVPTDCGQPSITGQESPFSTTLAAEADTPYAPGAFAWTRPAHSCRPPTRDSLRHADQAHILRSQPRRCSLPKNTLITGKEPPTNQRNFAATPR